MINKKTETFIKIVRAGLSGEKQSIESGFETELLYNIAKRHRIMGLCFYGAGLLGLDEDDTAMQMLYKGALSELSVHEKQKTETENLFCELEKEKISYMPLKGYLLKELYRRPELRTMGDADILIKMEEYPRIKEVMTRLGFEFCHESSNELVWKKGKIFNIELHRALFPSYNREFLSLFGHPWSNAVKDNTEYRYKMLPEDEFVFNFTHFVKHYKLGGIGVKHLCDLWVMTQNKKLDFAQIESKIEKLNLTEFYQNIKKTLNYWFADGEADEKTEIITKTVIKSGAFGTRKSSQNAFALRLASENEALKGKNKLAVWLFKIFPSAKYIEHKYPFLKKHKWLLPVAWIIRLFDATFVNQRKLKNGVKAIKNTDSERMKQIEKDFLAVGLTFSKTEE